MLLGRLNQPWLSTSHRYWPIFTRGAMYQGLHHASQSRIWSKTPFPKSADTAPLGLGNDHSPLWEPGKKASGKWDPDKLREPVLGVPETTLSFTDSRRTHRTRIWSCSWLWVITAKGYKAKREKAHGMKSHQNKAQASKVPLPGESQKTHWIPPATSCNNKSVKLLSAGEAC